MRGGDMGARTWMGAAWAGLFLLAACTGAGSGGLDDAGGRGRAGDSCLSAADCGGGLACVALVCTDALGRDAGGMDGGGLGGPGDSCLRSADCRADLRCVMMTCSVPTDGGESSSSSSGGSGSSTSMASSSSSSTTGGSSLVSSGPVDGGPGDGGTGDGGEVDAGMVPGGCQPGEPAPRGTGGCCTGPLDCVSGLCVQGMCSARCTEDQHCAVSAASTPFAPGTVLRCGAYDTEGGRACLPGSLQACGDGTACPQGERCAVVHAPEDGGLQRALACTTVRVGGADVAAPCSGSADCAAFHPAADACVDGLCRHACGGDVACTGNTTCVAPAPLPTSSPGFCLGLTCGQAPTGQDDLCEPGEACVPGSASAGTFSPRCRPVSAGLLAPGEPCSERDPWRCEHGLCVDGACSKLCQWDGDCPSAAPFCTERQLSAGTGAWTVAACTTLPADEQLCLRQADCGAVGCRWLGPRSLFSRCGVAGFSSSADPPCGTSRYCAEGSVCLPDVEGVPRCTPRHRMGEPCTAGVECLDGACVSPAGVSTTEAVLPQAGACSSRCVVAEDCAEGMACVGVERAEVTTMAGGFTVRHPMCWPVHDFQPCGGMAEACSGGATCSGGAADACHTPGADVGSPCQGHADCALGLWCAEDGTCVREGCTPAASGGGCAPTETCVSTGPITGQCRVACSATSECTALAADLFCADTDGDSMPDACQRMP